jgi:hypothetical protein
MRPNLRAFFLCLECLHLKISLKKGILKSLFSLFYILYSDLKEILYCAAFRMTKVFCRKLRIRREKPRFKTVRCQK